MTAISQLKRRLTVNDLDSLQEWLRYFQIGLPILLFFVVVIYETTEHLIIANSRHINPNFFGEVGFFGILGPIGVALVLGWIRQQLTHRLLAEEAVLRLNRMLEAKVRERTRRLEEANAELAQKNIELQTLDQLKDEFVTLVSHELLAPLTSLNGGLEMIGEVLNELPPPHQDTLKIVRYESARLTDLVRKILNVSALEAGHLQLKTGPVALPPLLHQWLSHHQKKTCLCELRLETPSELPFVEADEEYLAETVHNLLDNAIKYSPHGGLITISAWQSTANAVTIAISDQGLGIPAESHKQIFEKFYRVDESTSKEVYGHGLGLYFARKVIEAHGGQIQVSSAVGEGSTFTFTLPVAQEVEDAAQNPFD